MEQYQGVCKACACIRWLSEDTDQCGGCDRIEDEECLFAGAPTRKRVLESAQHPYYDEMGLMLVEVQ